MKRYLLIDIDNEGSVILDSLAYADFDSFLDQCFEHLNSNNIHYTTRPMSEEELINYQERECDAG